MNYKKQVLLFNVFFLLALITATLLYSYIPVLHSPTFRSISILSDVEKDSANIDTNIPLKKGQQQVALTGVVIKDYRTETGLINAAGNQVALHKFLTNLSDLQHGTPKKIRIGYFGDSFIEGDLITRDLRRMLQDEFGGEGVGFMPVTSISAGSRQSITQSFSKDWNDIHFKSDDKVGESLFLSGHVFYPVQGSWVSYQAVKENHLDSFYQMDVLYGKAKDGSALNLTINGNAQMLSGKSVFNSSPVKFAKSRNVNIADNTNSVPVYGFSFESDNGISVDNFSFRGISGVELDNLKPDLLNEIATTRPYDLLIIHYGPNLLFKPELVDFSWYRKKMEPTLEKIKKHFPNTSILLVSTADKAARYNGVWGTEKGVMPLIDTQYGMAQKLQLDFFNLYHAMGGKNSIVNWVEQQPSLANKDYTHVNVRGAKRVAELLFNAITNELNSYKKYN